MTSYRKEQIHTLLKGIETGEEASVAVVNPNKYIQHNPQTQEGGIGLAELFKQIAKSSPRVNIVRIFSDGDFVFAHTEYEFSNTNIGFEIFRFENDQTVEHWDNIQLKKGPNSSGHTMVDGPTEATDHEKTEYNREIVRLFIDEVLINNQHDKLACYITDGCYTEHSPNGGDGHLELKSALVTHVSDGISAIQYDKNHRLLAEGDFVLSANEGSLNGIHSSFYDLYRVSKGKIVEHWNTTEKIPPRNEWKNENGKF